MNGYYQRVSQQRDRLTAWVEQGGVLEAHLAAWGSNSGEGSLLTIPGGVRADQSFQIRNQVVLPGHPLVADVPEVFPGNFASQGKLVGLPAEAVIVIRDMDGAPTLAHYRLGAGMVVAGTQPYELAWLHELPAATILGNLLPFALSGSGQWLHVLPEQARIPPGDSLRVSLTLDAAALTDGQYPGSLQLSSNDPLASWQAFPVTLRVAGLEAALTLADESLEHGEGGSHLDVRLWLPDGVDPSLVQVASVRLNETPPDLRHSRIEGGEGGDDHDPRGTGADPRHDDRERRGPRLRLRFERDAVSATLPATGRGLLTLVGELGDGRRFLARDSVDVGEERREHGGGASAVREGVPTPPTAASFRLGPNPSAVREALRMDLALARGGQADVQVFAPDGRLVRAVWSGELAAGVHTLAWDGRDRAGREAPSGVYLVRVRAPGLSRTLRAVRVR